MTDAGRQFPAVQPGGSLILAWQVKGKNVLVVGGGEVSFFAPLAPCLKPFLSYHGLPVRLISRSLIPAPPGRFWSHPPLPQRRCRRHRRVSGFRPQR